MNLLVYFCKNHNKLCCASCITKIKGEGNGQHKDCEVCFIKEIKDEKKNKLKENIKSLEDLSNSFDNFFKELKEIFEKVGKNKEDLKLKVQKAFTKIAKPGRVIIIDSITNVLKSFKFGYFSKSFGKLSE